MTDKEIDYKILQRENENLLKANKDLVREIEKIQSDFTGKVAESEIKAQAVKEFAEKLWNKIKDNGIDYRIGLRALGEEIDELLKEYEK